MSDTTIAETTIRSKRRPSRAYLLRCWQEGESARGEEPNWRFLIEEISPERRRRGFSRLEELVAFLRAELARDPSEPGDESSKEAK